MLHSFSFLVQLLFQPEKLIAGDNVIFAAIGVADDVVTTDTGGNLQRSGSDVDDAGHDFGCVNPFQHEKFFTAIQDSLVAVWRESRLLAADVQKLFQSFENSFSDVIGLQLLQ